MASNSNNSANVGGFVVHGMTQQQADAVTSKEMPSIKTGSLGRVYGASGREKSIAALPSSGDNQITRSQTMAEYVNGIYDGSITEKSETTNNFLKEAEGYYNASLSSGDTDSASYWMNMVNGLQDARNSANNSRYDNIAKLATGAGARSEAIPGLIEAAQKYSENETDEARKAEWGNLANQLKDQHNFLNRQEYAQYAEQLQKLQEEGKTLQANRDNANRAANVSMAASSGNGDVIGTYKDAELQLKFNNAEQQRLSEAMAALDTQMESFNMTPEVQAAIERLKANGYTGKSGRKQHEADRQLVEQFYNGFGMNRKDYNTGDRARSTIAAGLETVGEGFSNLGAVMSRAVDYGMGVDGNVQGWENAGYATDELSAANLQRETNYEQNRSDYTNRWEKAGGNDTFFRYAAEDLEEVADSLHDRSASDLAAAKADLGKMGQFMVDAGHTIITIGADMALAPATGGSSLVPMFLRTFGSSAAEARRSGASFGKQIGYGALNASVETITEKMFGAFDKLGYGKGFLPMGGIEKALRDSVKSDAGKYLMTVLYNSVEEGMEEVFSDLAAPFAKWIIDEQSRGHYFSEIEVSELFKDFLLGASLGGMGAVAGTGQTVGTIRSENTTNLAAISQKQARGETLTPEEQMRLANGNSTGGLSMRQAGELRRGGTREEARNKRAEAKQQKATDKANRRQEKADNLRRNFEEQAGIPQAPGAHEGPVQERRGAHEYQEKHGGDFAEKASESGKHESSQLEEETPYEGKHAVPAKAAGQHTNESARTRNKTEESREADYEPQAKHDGGQKYEKNKEGKPANDDIITNAFDSVAASKSKAGLREEDTSAGIKARKAELKAKTEAAETAVTRRSDTEAETERVTGNRKAIEARRKLARGEELAPEDKLTRKEAETAFAAGLINKGEIKKYELTESEAKALEAAKAETEVSGKETAKNKQEKPGKSKSKDERKNHADRAAALGYDEAPIPEMQEKKPAVKTTVRRKTAPSERKTSNKPVASEKDVRSKLGNMALGDADHIGDFLIRRDSNGFRIANSASHKVITAKTADEAVRFITGKDVAPAKAAAQSVGKESESSPAPAPVQTGPQSAREYAGEQERSAKAGKEAIDSGKTNNQKLSAVVKQVDNYVSSGKTVANIQKDAFAKTGKDGDTPLSKKVWEWIKHNYGGKVYSDKLKADVVINERGIKDDISNGVGKPKAIVFQAVPAVIKNGDIVSRAEQDGKAKSIIVAGKVNLQGKLANVYCLLKADDTGANRFYLHEVSDGKGNLLYQLNEDGTPKAAGEGNKNSAPSALQDSTPASRRSAEEAPTKSIAQPSENSKSEAKRELDPQRKAILDDVEHELKARSKGESGWRPALKDIRTDTLHVLKAMIDSGESIMLDTGNGTWSYRFDGGVVQQYFNDRGKLEWDTNLNDPQNVARIVQSAIDNGDPNIINRFLLKEEKTSTKQDAIKAATEAMNGISERSYSDEGQFAAGYAAMDRAEAAYNAIEKLYDTSGLSFDDAVEAILDTVDLTALSVGVNYEDMPELAQRALDRRYSDRKSDSGSEETAPKPEQSTVERIVNDAKRDYNTPDESGYAPSDIEGNGSESDFLTNSEEGHIYHALGRALENDEIGVKEYKDALRQYAPRVANMVLEESPESKLDSIKLGGTERFDVYNPFTGKKVTYYVRNNGENGYEVYNRSEPMTGNVTKDGVLKFLQDGDINYLYHNAPRVGKGPKGKAAAPQQASANEEKAAKDATPKKPFVYTPANNSNVQYTFDGTTLKKTENGKTVRTITDRVAIDELLQSFFAEAGEAPATNAPNAPETQPVLGATPVSPSTEETVKPPVESPETPAEPAEEPLPKPSSKKRPSKQSFREKSQTKGARRNADDGADFEFGKYDSATNAEVSRIADHRIDTRGYNAEFARLNNSKNWDRTDFAEAQRIVFRLTDDLYKRMASDEGLVPRAANEKADEWRARCEAKYQEERAKIDELLETYRAKKSEAAQNLQQNYKFNVADEIRMRAAYRFMNFTANGRVEYNGRSSTSVRMYRIIDNILTKAEKSVANDDIDAITKIVLDVSDIRGNDQMFGATGRNAEAEALEFLKASGATVDDIANLAYGNINSMIDDFTPVKALDAVNQFRILNMLSNIKTALNNILNNAAGMRVGAVSQNIGNLAAREFEKATGKKVAINDKSWKRSKEGIKAEQVAFVNAALMSYYGIQIENGRIELQNGANFRPTGNWFERLGARYSFFVNTFVMNPDQMGKARIDLGIQQGIDEAFEGVEMTPEMQANKKELEGYKEHEKSRRLVQADNATTALVQHFKDYLNKVKVGNDNIGYLRLGDFAMAFAKVPVNIVQQRIAATPYGALYHLLNSAKGFSQAKQMHQDVLAGKEGAKEMSAFDMARYSRDVGRAATTGGMLAIGALAAMTGALKDFGNDDDDDDETRIWREKGFSGLSLNISAMLRPFSSEWRDGDWVVGADFLEVFAAPLSIGALAWEAHKDGMSVSEAAWYATKRSFTDVLDAIADIPGMQAASQMYEAYTYSTGDNNDLSKAWSAVRQYLANSAASYVMPNLITQTATALDNNVRNPYAADNALQQSYRIFANKIPFLRNTLPVKTDMWGNARTYGDNRFEAFLNKVVLPGQIHKFKTNEYEKEIIRLSRAGYGGLLPNGTTPKKIEVGDNTYSLDSDQSLAFDAAYKDRYTEAYEAFMDSDLYKQLDDPQRQAALKMLRLDVTRQTKQEFLDATGAADDVTMDKWESLGSLEEKLQFVTAKQIASAAWDSEDGTVADYAMMDNFIQNQYDNLSQPVRDVLGNSLTHLDDMYNAYKEEQITSQQWQTCYDIYRQYNAKDEDGHALYKANIANSAQMWAEMQRESGLSDHQMSYIEDNMQMHTIISPNDDQYKEYLNDAGMTREETARTIKAMSELAFTDGYASVQNSQKYHVIAQTVPKEKQWAAFWSIVPGNASKANVAKMRKAQESGMSFEDALKSNPMGYIYTKTTDSRGKTKKTRIS